MEDEHTGNLADPSIRSRTDCFLMRFKQAGVNVEPRGGTVARRPFPGEGR